MALQAAGRVIRMGQKRSCFIWILTADQSYDQVLQCVATRKMLSIMSTRSQSKFSSEQIEQFRRDHRYTADDAEALNLFREFNVNQPHDWIRAQIESRLLNEELRQRYIQLFGQRSSRADAACSDAIDLTVKDQLSEEREFRAVNKLRDAPTIGTKVHTMANITLCLIRIYLLGSQYISHRLGVYNQEFRPIWPLPQKTSSRGKTIPCQIKTARFLFRRSMAKKYRRISSRNHHDSSVIFYSGQASKFQSALFQCFSKLLSTLSDLLIPSSKMSNFASSFSAFKSLSNNLARVKNWDDDEKKLYRIQNNDFVIISKKIKVLKITKLERNVDKKKQKALKANQRDKMIKERIANDFHNNPYW